jgi:hypothetical protein
MKFSKTNILLLFIIINSNRSRLSRMIDVSNVLRKRSPLSCRRKSRLTSNKINQLL